MPATARRDGQLQEENDVGLRPSHVCTKQMPYRSNFVGRRMPVTRFDGAICSILTQTRFDQSSLPHSICLTDDGRR
jgi:hypothetical protein